MRRRLSSISQTLSKDVLLRILIGWFKPLGAHKNPVFPNYKQKRAQFSLGDLNRRLPAPVIKSRSRVGPGNASVKVTTSATVKV
jgi:hypothetical protein